MEKDTEAVALASGVSIRSAAQRHAAELAILVDIAAHGFASWLWYGAVMRGEVDTAMERGRLRMRDARNHDSWKNALVAEIDGEVVGASIGFRVPESILQEEPPHPALAPLLALQQRAVGNWFVDSLAVYRAHRGKGIARALLGHEVSRGEGRPLSLIAESCNATALRLYEAFGFRQLERRDAFPIHETREPHQWVLMERH
ncbi:GNAT family N-acetyltransferase [Chelativorans sp. M5D2P16]|uniref:GNAT family N-acetyltransferase n=1 Tax=Chelativorans sp. M5D2P16 TaxID=3095678 RepID=UPI002ACA7A92|nr:GNAT family N-acetyltransferase [Chelativorans sp. M5D2P16]MDZ5697737.1 GNAT family N-acetyltransferase [Chelativorans sp. M5D2P16]